MSVVIPEVRAGEPCICGNVTVFPLFVGPPVVPVMDYVLASEAMAKGTLVVREVSRQGDVGELTAENVGNHPVLFLEGEELKGARQNRVLCSSVLASAGSRTNIPVLCAERGRWEYSSPRFAPGSRCPPTMRYLLKQTAYAVGRFAGQASFWETIRRQHARLGVRSRSENMSDALETRRDATEDMRRNLRYVEGASGIAVALGGKVVGIDIFDRTATCKAIWGRIVESLLLDAVDLPDTGRRASVSDVSVKLYKTKVMRWQRVDSVGMGEAYRGRDDDDTLATALVTGDTLIHLSMSMP